MNIFVGGVNGSGKTTILDLVHTLRPSWIVTKSSQAFMEWLGFPNDYPRLQALDPIERDTKLAEFMNITIERGTGSTQLLDSHYLNLKYGIVDRVTGSWLKDFDALVLISTPSPAIIDRMKGTSRFSDRALFSGDYDTNEQEAALQDYIDRTEKEFFVLASRYKLPHLKIENIDQEHATSALISFIESLSQRSI